MVASDFRIAARGEHLRQIHRHLPRPDHGARAALAAHLAAVNAVELAHGALDLVDRDPPAIGRQDIGQLLFGQLQGHFLPRQLGIGDQLVEAADQFAHIARDRPGQEIEHICRYFERREAGKLGCEDLLAQFDIGCLDIGHQSHRETRKQARFHTVQSLGRAVCGKYQPLAFGQQRIDRIEEFFPRAGLADI